MFALKKPRADKFICDKTAKGAASIRTGLTLQNSTFLHFYDQIPKRPSVEQVAAHLTEVASSAVAEKFRNYPGDVGEKAARLWTSNEIYRDVNRDLIADHSRLEHWCWFLRAMNCFVVGKHLTEDLVLWRGAKFSKDVFDRLPVGHAFRDPTVVAMSESIDKAKSFAATYLCEIRIPAGCWNCSGVMEDITEWGGEMEHVLPPYTVLTCIGKDKDRLVYEVAMDNRDFDTAITPEIPNDDCDHLDICAACFAGDSQIHLADGSILDACKIQVGQLLAPPRMAQDQTPSTVQAVWKSTLAKPCLLANMSSFTASGSNLVISADHPICINDQWFHPSEMAKPFVGHVNELFNFVLSGPHGIVIDGIEVASVGMRVDRFPDPFWGGHQIVDVLCGQADWPTVHMRPNEKLHRLLLGHLRSNTAVCPTVPETAQRLLE